MDEATPPLAEKIPWFYLLPPKGENCDHSRYTAYQSLNMTFEISQAAEPAAFQVNLSGFLPHLPGISCSC